MSWEPNTWRYPPESMFSLEDRSAIVTGAASGLGRAIACGLDACGATVVAADRDGEGVQEVADHLSTESHAAVVDVTDISSLEALRATTLERHGDFDVLCNVPGINVRKSVIDLSPAEWHDVIEVNLTGMFYANKVLGAHLVERGGGTVLNMASVRGIAGGTNQSAYSASKGGVVQLTKVLAAEWAPDVRVNALAPGYMKTPLVREAMSDEEWYDRMRSEHLLDRFGDPEEVVGATVFLTSEASSFVTGTVLPVDGGWTAT